MKLEMVKIQERPKEEVWICYQYDPEDQRNCHAFGKHCSHAFPHRQDSMCLVRDERCGTCKRI